MIQRRLSHLVPHLPLLLVLSAFALTVVFVNPLREMPTYDDWAYSWTVDKLFETGQYVQHPWIVPNNIAQIYWGALFQTLFGHSFIALRASTLVLTVLMLVAFYFLAREFQISHPVSGLLTLLLAASPINLTFGFSFMTDLPFLSLMTTALWLYTRAIRTGSLGWMIAGGIVGGLATLTRQVGVGFAPALIVLWLIAGHDFKKLPAYLIGCIPPVLGTLWQVYMGVSTPSWTATRSTAAELAYIGNVGGLIPETLWRLMAILQMVCLIMLPLAILTIIQYVQVLQKTRHVPTTVEPARTDAMILLGWGGFIVVMMLAGTFIFDKPGQAPFLALTFWYLGKLPPAGLALLTSLTTAGTFCIGRLIILRYANGAWRTLPTHERLLDLATVFILAVNIFWFFYIDRYTMPLQPFLLIVMGRAVSATIGNHFRLLIVIVVIWLAFFANIVRADMAAQEAQAIAADRLLGTGVQPNDISASWTWDSLHGAFDDFMITGGEASTSVIDDYFNLYIANRLGTTPYLIWPFDRNPDPQKWQVVDSTLYTDVMGRDATVLTLRRLDDSSQ